MPRTRAFITATAIALAGLTSSPVMAAGTLSGTEITSSAQIGYQVNGTPQAPLTVTDKLTVDRLILYTLENLTGLAQPVVPGQKDIPTKIRINNLSNAPVSFTADYFAGPTWLVGDTNPVVPSQRRVFLDSNGNGTWDAASDQLLDGSWTNIQPDMSSTIFWVVDFPNEASAFNGKTINAATWVFAIEPNIPGNSAPIFFWQQYATLAAAPNTSGVDTVLSDPDQYLTPYEGSIANDGEVDIHISYVISSASLSVARFNKVISDSVNGTTNPKVIPSALMEYCLAVSNAAGAATATDVNIAETLAANLTFDSTFGVYQSGTVTGGACDTVGAGGGAPGGNFSGGKVTGTISSIAAGETKTIRYRATVN